MKFVFDPKKWKDFTLEESLDENCIYIGVTKTGKLFYFIKSDRWGEFGLASVKPGVKSTTVVALKTLPIYYCSGEEFGVRSKR